MSKRLLTNDTNRPPIRLRLPQRNSQELKMVEITITRTDVPQDTVYTGTLIRSLDDAGSLILHKPGEGERPIFDRQDVIVNLDFEERIVVAIDTLRSSKSEERKYRNSKYRSTSRLKQRSCRRAVDEHINRTDKCHTYNNETAATYGVKNRPRSASKERQRSSSRDREHVKLYRRKSPKSESYWARDREAERTSRTRLSRYQ